MVHAGEEQYGKEFNRKGNMIAHKVIHANLFI